MADLTIDERAAARAYLQRSEVRLSTIHRVATALLSGAGIMVLLPVVGRDAVVQVLRHLFTGHLDLEKGLLAFAVLVALIVPLLSLLLVFRDLTGFYFHANHLDHHGASTFAPRFTLTGLQLPGGELGGGAASELAEQRARPDVVELLVPDNDSSRRRIDDRLAAYGWIAPEGAETSDADRARAQALFDLAASRERSLLEEVAKVEHGMARHVLRIQMIVLRYVKAVMALLSTALAVFAAAAVVDGKATLGRAEEAWLGAIVVMWAPFVVVAVSTPVRWLDALLRSEGATNTAIGHDADLTLMEDVTVRLGTVGFAAAAVVLVMSLSHSSISGGARIVGALVLIASTFALGSTLRRRRSS